MISVRRPNGGWAGVAVSRLVLEYVNGSPLGGLWALHHCDNGLCVRPDHLYAGTARQNSADAVARGHIRPHGRAAASPMQPCCELPALVCGVRPSEVPLVLAGKAVR